MTYPESSLITGLVLLAWYLIERAWTAARTRRDRQRYRAALRRAGHLR